MVEDERLKKLIGLTIISVEENLTHGKAFLSPTFTCVVKYGKEHILSIGSTEILEIGLDDEELYD